MKHYLSFILFVAIISATLFSCSSVLPDVQCVIDNPTGDTLVFTIDGEKEMTIAPNSNEKVGFSRGDHKIAMLSLIHI